MDTTHHRTLYTGDVNYLFANNYHPQGKETYDASVLREHVRLLADSGVDTYLVNPNGQLPWYPSQALDHVLTGYSRGDRDFVRSCYPAVSDDFPQERLDVMLDKATAMLDRYLDLVEADMNWLAETAAACRDHGVSPWLSIRMNDAHGANSWDTCYMNCPPQRDEANRLDGRPFNPANPPEEFLRVCNYQRQEVRDYYLAMIRELIESYDFEGIELDWLRTPLCMNPPASQTDIDLMIGWIREIRELTRRKARQNGRPYPLGLRIPAQLGMLKTHGLDVIALAGQQLIDFVSPSNFWQTTWDLPYDRMRAKLGSAVAIYGVIEDAPNWLFARSEDHAIQSYRLLSASPSLIRGNAAGKLAMGVDGIEFFNFFCTDAKGVHGGAEEQRAKYEAIKGISDLQNLRGRPKQYALSTSFTYWSPPPFETADQLPAFVEQDAWHTFTLAMCSEPLGVEKPLALTVQLVIDKTDALPELGVSLNGSWPTFAFTETDELLEPAGPLSHHLAERIGLNFAINVTHLEDGINELRVYHGRGVTHAHETAAKPVVRILSVEAIVR